MKETVDSLKETVAGLRKDRKALVDQLDELARAHDAELDAKREQLDTMSIELAHVKWHLLEEQEVVRARGEQVAKLTHDLAARDEEIERLRELSDFLDDEAAKKRAAKAELDAASVFESFDRVMPTNDRMLRTEIAHICLLGAKEQMDAAAALWLARRRKL